LNLNEVEPRLATRTRIDSYREDRLDQF
jgi:hypothetical protein